MGKIGLLAFLLAAPGSFGIDIFVNVGGGHCPTYSYNSYPIFWPPYSYAGYVPYYSYSAPYPFYRSGSSSYDGPGGGYVRLGEQHDAFWDRHGGFEPASYSAAAVAPWPEDLPVIDRKSPLEVGDAESRIRDLDLEVQSIAASGDTAVYRLADGRKVTAEQGVIVDIGS